MQRSRWFNQFDLQTRLFVIFSLLFLFAAFVMGYFLYTSGEVIGINTEARQTYESARATYRLQTLVQKMELSHNVYLADEDFDARGDFFAYDAQLKDEIANIRAEQITLSWDGIAPDAAVLDQLEALRQQYAGIFDQIAAAIDSEDYEQAYALDGQTYDLLEQMYAEIDTLNLQSNEALTDIQDSADLFSMISFFMVSLTVPVFLIIIAIAVIVIHFQINTPLEKLLQATRSLGESKFNPRNLDDLTPRSDEIGLLANGFNQMAAAVLNRESELRAEAEKYRARIR